jgi:hypothetical protein
VRDELEKKNRADQAGLALERRRAMTRIDAWYEACRLVPLQLRADLAQYLDGKEASREFLDYLNDHEDLQQACDNVFRSDSVMKQIAGMLPDMQSEATVSQFAPTPAV